jgi:hypothetical protein
MVARQVAGFLKSGTVFPADMLRVCCTYVADLRRCAPIVPDPGEIPALSIESVLTGPLLRLRPVFFF